MPTSRKRTRRETEPVVETTTKPAAQKEVPSLLQQIRNTWQFANLYQWICLFGKVVKIDDNLDIDDLEAELLKHRSVVLVDIGVALLKWVSSHRGLTPELFDEYTRRQYVAKAPESNPFGIEEQPAQFHDFDAFTKLRVLQQLTRWVMLHPERVREKMDEQRPMDQTEWRIEPSGWDGEDRTYYILDDNRLYRMTEAPLAPSNNTAWKPKKNTQKAKAAARAAKRRRISRSSAAHEGNDVDDDAPLSDTAADGVVEPQDDGLGGAKWECVAANLEEVRSFLASIKKSRDENEKILRSRIEDHLLPILEKQEESRKRKMLQKEKELLALEKMAHAKRSSRLAGKVEQQRLDAQRREEEERQRAEEAAARKEELARHKMEKERDNRLMSRERRLQEREVRRIQHEKELAQLSEDSKSLSGDNARLSERRLKAEIDKNRKALQEIEDDWIFDCICGVYGQVDDGTHSVACERCNVWQHSSCLGIKEEDAERDDFHFICSTCQRVSKSPVKDVKPTIIKLKVNRGEPPTSPKPSAAEQEIEVSSAAEVQPGSSFQVEIPSKLANKPDLSPTSQSAAVSNPQLPPTTEITIQNAIPVKASAQPNLPPPPSPQANGDSHHAFSSPHPALSPPDQSPNKARVYSGVYNDHSSPVSVISQTKEKKVPVKGIFRLSPKSNGVSIPNLANSPSVPKETSSGTTISPTKKSTEDMTAPPVQSPQGVSFSSATTTVVSPSASFSTPQLKHGNNTVTSPVLTPKLSHAQNGISPLKRSPPPPTPISGQARSDGSFQSTPAPSILPPSTALSPSPSQTILTPPVKPADPVRPASQQSVGSSFGKL